MVNGCGNVHLDRGERFGRTGTAPTGTSGARAHPPHRRGRRGRRSDSRHSPMASDAGAAHAPEGSGAPAVARVSDARGVAEPRWKPRLRLHSGILRTKAPSPPVFGRPSRISSAVQRPRPRSSPRPGGRGRRMPPPTGTRRANAGQNSGRTGGRPGRQTSPSSDARRRGRTAPVWRSCRPAGAARHRGGRTRGPLPGFACLAVWDALSRRDVPKRGARAA